MIIVNNADKDYADMEIVLGAGSLSGDHMGSLRDLLGMPDEFYYKVYDGLHEKVSVSDT